MDDIIANLEPWQKKHLHDVADGMLNIYRTLVRMQFINDFDIVQGPHDMTHILPFCRKLKVDDSIIYLYSILPYVEGGGDFVGRGAMLDLRSKRAIKEARNPMYANSDEMPRPWMTALSSIANHDTALVYDARKHVIGMFCQDGFESTDRNLRDHTPSTSSQGDVDDKSRADVESHTEGGSMSDQWEDEESGGENSTNQGNPWDQMEARPAPKVLRDIVRWYEQLIELPGVGEYSGADWHPTITEPLYTKHGWPSSDFDGEAFLVDKAITCAETRVKRKRRDNKPVRDAVAELEEQLSVHKEEKESRRAQTCKYIIAKPRHFAEEWIARWELHQIEDTGRSLRQQLQAEKEKAENITVVGFEPSREQLILDDLKGSVQYNEGLVDNVKTQIAGAKDDNDQIAIANRTRLPGLEKKAKTLRKAYETYQKDNNVMPLVRPNYCDGPMDLREHLWYAIQTQRTMPGMIELSRHFLETVPKEATRAHMEAEHKYKSQSEDLKRAEEQMVQLKKQLLDQGYNGWPLEHCD